MNELRIIKKKVHPVVEIDDVRTHALVPTRASSLFTTGFTLIETMIATALFTVIMIIGTGAVLNANGVHKKTQSTRAVIDTMHFIMEDMARNIRLGSYYRCPAGTSNMLPGGFTNGEPRDCSVKALSKTLAFDPVDRDPLRSVITDQHIYTILPDQSEGGIVRIFKSTNGGNSYIPLTPLDVEINDKLSGFVVTGLDDAVQPQVVIRLNGTVTTKDSSTEFSLQTTVSQRLLDVPQL